MAIRHVLTANEITVTTWDGKHSLTMERDVFSLNYLGDRRVIPFNRVISMQVKDPKGKLRPGMITLELDASPSTIFHVTAGFSFMSGKYVKFPHSIDDLDAGQEMLRQFQAYQRRAAAADHGAAPSAADEILKFKALLDAGAITQEEYERKKKQLLGV